jgi:hypothetical protein
MKSLRFLLFILLAFPATVLAQKDTPYLERVITITLSNERLDLALKKIGEQAGFTFSYNPSILEANRTVTYSFTKKTVREILDQLFSGTIEYKIRANHIILTKSKETSKQDDQILSGYVVDEATGERLKNVSVYDPVTLTSAVTDSYGYFEMKVDKPSTDIRLSVNKQSYSDTLITVPSGNGRLLNIPIHIDKKKLLTVADSVGQKIKRLWRQLHLPPPKNPNLVNIQDTIQREVQFSVVPFLGTNHLMSGNVINDYSFNLLGGYNKGVRKFEMGGIFNINGGDVQNVQLAGCFNVVAGNVTGFQGAGIFNANYGKASGGQLAGLMNVNWNSSPEFSGAGLINFTRGQSKGVHLAGLLNFTMGEQHGVHAAGLFNFSTETSTDVQAAGLFNFTAREVRGVQAAGLLNFAGKDVRGTQMAGLLNFAGKKVTGTQLSGLLNYATKVNGSQIGIFNIADSVKGVPVGIFSFVMKGYHKIEVSADEVFYLNTAFRTGVHQFYNIFTAGAKPNTFSDNQTYWTFGYGVGTAPRLTNRLSMNIDITSSQIIQDRKIEAINLLNKVYVGVDFHTSKNLSFILGATLNGYLTDSTFDGYKPLFTDYNPKLIANENFDKVNLKMWLGAKVGVRFL